MCSDLRRRLDQLLRRTVVWRKLSSGTRGESGSQFVEAMLITIETCRKQHRSMSKHTNTASPFPHSSMWCGSLERYGLHRSIYCAAHAPPNLNPGHELRVRAAPQYAANSKPRLLAWRVGLIDPSPFQVPRANRRTAPPFYHERREPQPDAAEPADKGLNLLKAGQFPRNVHMMCPPPCGGLHGGR